MAFITGSLLAKFVIIPLVIAAVAITFKQIANWFKERKKLKESDKDNIAFTLKQELDSGNYVVCQGIFNTKTEELLDGQKLQGKVDEELEAQHQGRPLVIYS